MKSKLKGLLYFVNVVLYFTLVLVWIAIPEELTLNFSLLVFNAVLTSLLLISDRRRYKKIYNSGKFKIFTSTFIGSFLILSILGMVNYFAFKHPRQLDLSELERNSLTKESIQILHGLDKKIIFRVFARKSAAPAYVALLDLYRNHGNSVEIEIVDSDLHPEVVKSFDITHPGTTVVEYDGRTERVLVGNELSYTNALIKVSRERDPIVYFSAGHRELDLTRSDKDGLSKLLDVLKKSLFVVRSHQTMGAGDIPSDADLYVIWGPKSAFLDQEIATIERYITRGGKLVVALDPDLNSDRFSNLRRVFSRRGIVLANDLVVDSIKHVNGSNGSVPLINKFGDHSVVRDLKGPVFFPLVSSIFEGDAVIPGDIVTLLNTSSFPASWAEKTPKEIAKGKVTFHKDKDVKGPISLLALWKARGEEKKSGRVAVFGNSTFVINGYRNFANNFILFKNILVWAIDEKRILAFNLPIAKDEPVFISAPQLGTCFYFSVVFAPLILFIAAGFLYLRRRKS